MKTYTDEEIDSLINDVKEQFLSPLIKEATELAKSEGSRIASATEGGNGSEPKGEVARGEAGNGPRSDALKSLGSLGGEKDNTPEGPRSKALMAKTDGTFVPGPGKMVKDEEVMVKEGSDEADPKPKPPADSASDSSPSPSPDVSASPDAPPPDASTSAPVTPSPDAAPAPGGDPAAQQGGDEMSLEQAYASLSDQDLQAHMAAFMNVMKQRMSGGASDAGAPPAMPSMGGSDAGAMAPPPPAPVAPPPAPAAKSMMAPTMPAMKSETSLKLEELAKTEVVVTLQKQVDGLTKVLEGLLTPQRKAVTSMAEFLAKSEADKPQPVKLSRSEVLAKLGKAAQSSKLEKSDRDLINRYVLEGNVKLSEIEHLLK